MEGAVTWQQFAWLIGGLVTFGAAQLYAIWKMFQTVHGRISNTRLDMSNFRLEVAEKYVSITHLADVERKLLDEGKETRKTLSELTVAITRLEERLHNRSGDGGGRQGGG